jgi:hypothetical protein
MISVSGSKNTAIHLIIRNWDYQNQYIYYLRNVEKM